ncbi:MAG TPA: NAD(P)-dependent alcohol dehydrogenase [Anaerolineales bacterium]
MKAIVWTKYGAADGLQLREVPKPAPKASQVLIRVYATTVTAGDCELRSMKFNPLLQLPLRLFLGFGKPRNVILGQEVAGEIEAAGQDVTRFRTGDQVFGWTGLHLGAYAEYVCLDANGVLAIKPGNLTYEQAAAVPVGGIEALHFLRKANIRAGEKVLINGAGGSIGTIGVQFVKLLGAEVTAVDSAEKLDVLRALGAVDVVDYAREDFTKRGQTYDVIFDVIGKSSFSESVRSLNPNGRYLLGNPGLFQTFRRLITPLAGGKTVITRSANVGAAELILLKQLIEAGKLRAVIDRRYPLEQTAEAHRYVQAGHKKGSVVITIG